MYIKTRNWEREQRATQIETSRRTLQIAAAIATAKPDNITALFNSYNAEIERLREPELPRPGWVLTAKQREFMHFSGIRNDPEE